MLELNNKRKSRSVMKPRKLWHIPIVPEVEEIEEKVVDIVPAIFQNVYNNIESEIIPKELNDYEIRLNKDLEAVRKNMDPIAPKVNEHCEKCSCFNDVSKKSIRLDSDNKLNNNPEIVDSNHIENPSFFTVTNHKLYMHKNGWKYVVDDNINTLKMYDPIIHETKQFATIPTEAEDINLISLKQYNRLIAAREDDLQTEKKHWKKQIELYVDHIALDETEKKALLTAENKKYKMERAETSTFDFPKMGKMEFNTKLMFDNKQTYNYDHDILYYDIETMATDGNFAGINNPTSIIAMIQMLHITRDYSKSPMKETR